jgi:membrane-anchored protein YejM (alkaline phosphatase superfamily)
MNKKENFWGENSPNFLLVTLDSCRWDTYKQAEMPALNHICQARCAYAQATFTYAAHMAMFQGVFPHVREPLPFYNRYARQLIRIANRATMVPSFVTFLGGTENIVAGFRQQGYYTLGLGAMEWFRHPHLTESFEEFHMTGIHAQKQVDILLERTKPGRPFFALLNFGETHDPYQFSVEGIPHSMTSRARRQGFPTGHFDEEGWKSQIRSCEYLDKQLAAVFSHLRGIERPTILIVCGDHGECFGEDGLFGHGFYHPKVMEVPLAIFDVNGQLLYT